MRLIGFSTSLTWGAPGHYLPVHSALNNEFKKLDPNSIYIGGDLTNGNEVWWLPWAPTSLRTRPNFVSLRKIRELTNLVGDKDGVLIDYEGRISHMFLLSYITRNTNTLALVNFHYTSELSNFTKSKLGAFLFKLTINFAKKLSEHRLFFTTESDQLSLELKKKIGQDFPAFPAFSVLEQPNLSEVQNWKEEEKFIWVICRISNDSAEMEALESMIERNSSSIFLIHGLNENLKSRISKFDHILFQEMFVSLENYRKSLYTCSNLVLVYDTGLYRNHSSGRLLDSIMFEKPLITIEGMPIPKHVTDSKLIQTMSLVELSSIDFSKKNKSEKFRVSIFPDSAWAVSELNNIIKSISNVSQRSKSKSATTFYSFWFISFLIRLCFSIFYRVIRPLRDHQPSETARQREHRRI
jgi:hypothetical protein